MMRTAWALAILISVSTAARASAAGPDEAGLRAADAEQMRIVVQGDTKAQQAFMHENYMFNSPANELRRKADVLKMLAQGALRTDHFERTIEGLQITGDLGIVMGRESVAPADGSQLAGIYGGRSLQRRFTNVYLYEAGRWTFLARQATVIAASPGP